MRIGILGSGLMGGTLGGLWAAAGHDVTFAYARDRAKLDRLARQAGGRSGTVAEAAEAEVLLLAVPWSRVDDVLEQAGDLARRMVLNCCVPLDATNTDLVTGPTESGAEELARMRPAARWVSCFNTTPSESLAPVFSRKTEGGLLPHVLTYGDDAEAKEIAGDLIRDIGFDPLDTGGLRNGRFVEPFAMATVELAYVQPGSPALTYRFDKLTESERRDP